MKIAPRAIEGFLKQPSADCRAILLYGPDSGLARQRAQQIKSQFLGKSDDPFALVELSEASIHDDPARLADEVQAIGFLSPKRCILIRDAGDKLTPAIKDAALALHADVLLIAVAGELGTRSALRAWFESAENAAAIGCYRDEIRDLQALISKSFAEHRISASREVTDYLVSQLGNDREVTRSELEKIITFVGDSRTLSIEEAEALVGYNRDMQVDDIVNAAADKNLRELDRMLSVHLREGTMPIIYLRALLRYFNRLYFIKARAEAGYDIEATIANLKPKVFYKQVPLLTRHARNWSLPVIVRALKLLTAAELAFKTSDVPPVAASSRRLYQVAQAR